MSLIEPGGIDCDLHPAVPNIKALYPYLSDHWRDIAIQRGIGELDSLSYPTNSPLTARPDWRVEGSKPGSDLALLRRHALEPFLTSIAIGNCLYGVQLLFSEDLGAGFAKAVNDWMAAEWLDKEPRLRASIVVPVQNPDMAVDEINRVAGDKRFVQVLLLVMGEMPLGKRHSRRQRVSPSCHVSGLADLLHRGLRGAGAGLSAMPVEPDLRGRIHEI